MTKAERGYGNEQIRMDKENNYNSGWFRGGGIWNHACLICWVWWRNSCLLWQGISETFHVSIGMASMIVAIIMITFAFSTTDHRYILVQFYIRLYIAFVLIYLQIYMCTVRICG